MKEKANSIKRITKYPATSVKKFDFSPIEKMTMKNILNGIVNIIKSKQ